MSLRAFFLTVVVALGLAGCTGMDFQPDNTDVNGNITYTDAGGE